MLILNPDLINSCRVCRSPNQDADYQCLFGNSSEHEDTAGLSEAGILYEKLLDIYLNERKYYPQFLCNSCDLQMKLFIKLKDKAIKTMEYLESIYGDVIVDETETVESDNQANEQIIFPNESQNCQDVLDDYQLKVFDVCRENEAPQYALSITADLDPNKVDINTYENKNDKYQIVDFESELDKLTSNSPYNHVLLEQECLYAEQQLTNFMASNIASNLEGDIVVQIDSTKTQSNADMMQESISDENIPDIKLEPILDQNDYVTEIYELIDDECDEGLPILENQETAEDSMDLDTYTELITETSSTYNDIEYLLEDENCDSEDYANQIECNISNAIKRRSLKNKSKKSRSYKCLSCELEFTNLQDYKLHRTEVHNENYTCNACSKEFRTISALQKHLKSQHNNEPAFQCEICFKTFNQKVHFQYHMNHHNNIRNFKCDICEKAFIAKSDLKTHLRFHTGVRPYVCNICGKDYLMTEHLKTHLLTHTEQTFPCSVCHKQFTTHKTLRLHVKTIHEDAPRFKCTFCLKPFRRKHHLEYHLKSHQKNVNSLEIRDEIINDSSNLEDFYEESIDDPGFISLA